MECGHFSEEGFSFCRECTKERNFDFLENFRSKNKDSKPQYQNEFRVLNQAGNFQQSITRRNFIAQSRIRKVEIYDKADVDSFTPEDIMGLRELQNNECVCCFKSFDEVAFEIDHIRPVNCGGGNQVSNLQLLCKPCNFGKRDRHNEAWLSKKNDTNK